MAQTIVLQPVFYNMGKWILANKGSFTPPVGLKMMHASQLNVFFVGGPNTRSDYHLEEGEEFFYMVKGTMQLKVLSQGTFKDVIIREGEVFLLPSRIPHSPQRAANTVGLVIERERKPSELDCMRWYVENSDQVLFERWLHVIDMNTEMVLIIQEYDSSEQRKTGAPIPEKRSFNAGPLGNTPRQVPRVRDADFDHQSMLAARKQCCQLKGTVTKDAPFQADEGCKLEDPKPLRTWINDHKHEIQEKGYKRLFDGSYQSDVTVYGAGNQDGITGLHETFVWQIDGSRIITIHGKQYELDAGDTLLIPSDAAYHSRGSDNSYSLFVTMNPHENKKF